MPRGLLCRCNVGDVGLLMGVVFVFSGLGWGGPSSLPTKDRIYDGRSNYLFFLESYLS